MTEVDPLFLSDADLAKRLGLGERTFRIAAQQPGFPPKKRIWGSKRYWPAVKAFLDRTNGLTVTAPTVARDWEENWDEDSTEDRRVPRAKVGGAR